MKIRPARVGVLWWSDSGGIVLVLQISGRVDMAGAQSRLTSGTGTGTGTGTGRQRLVRVER